MIAAIRRLFERPVFKTAVFPFDKQNDYYAVYYSNNNGRTWAALTKSYTPAYLHKSPELWDHKHTILFSDFEQAVNYARKWQSIKQVELHLAEEREKFITEYKKALEARHKRYRQWVSY
jgi:hypothetical protein